MQGTFQEKRAQMAQGLEKIYLGLFALILFYLYLKITSFPIPWKVFTLNADGKTMLWVKVLFQKEQKMYLVSI